MSPDLDLASGLLRDLPKARRQFARRFREALDRGFEHGGEALDIGLDSDRFLRGVAGAAARSLLAALPLTTEEARLDPFVRRICSRREFGLTLLLQDDHEAAWPIVQQRYRAFTGSLMLRRGVAGDRVGPERDALFRELREVDASGRRPIDAYFGRSDFRDWLFVYVRTRFRGGLPAEASPLLSVPPVADAEERELRDAWPEVFGALLGAMSASDRHLLERAAFGLADEATEEDAKRSQALQRHRELVDRTFRRTAEVLAARLGRKVDDVDEALRGLLVDEVEERLRSVCGVAAP